jgi:hypothetical protein
VVKSTAVVGVVVILSCILYLAYETAYPVFGLVMLNVILLSVTLPPVVGVCPVGVVVVAE